MLPLGCGSSGRQALAALGAAAGQHLAAAHRGHAGAETVPALADQLRGLIGALHDILRIKVVRPMAEAGPPGGPVAGRGLYACGRRRVNAAGRETGAAPGSSAPPPAVSVVKDSCADAYR